MAVKKESKNPAPKKKAPEEDAPAPQPAQQAAPNTQARQIDPVNTAIRTIGFLEETVLKGKEVNDYNQCFALVMTIAEGNLAVVPAQTVPALNTQLEEVQAELAEALAELEEFKPEPEGDKVGQESE